MAPAFSSVGSAGGLEPAVDGGNLHVDLLDTEMLYIVWECMLWCSLHPIRTPPRMTTFSSHAHAQHSKSYLLFTLV